MRRALMILMVLVPWTMAQESVVFVRETPEQRHGALVLLERGRERVLVEDRVSMPCLAPDARSVAFLDHSGAETYPKLTLLEIESGTRRTLATRMPPQAVRYSPDSRTLLFAGWEESMLAEIYTVPCTGGTPKRLTSTTGRSPVFSPDGAWIAYMAFGEGGHDGLCEMRADGTEWRRLAPARARDSRPDFSHDGRWLVCQDYEDADDKALRGVVWLIDRQGGTPRRLSQPSESAWAARFMPDDHSVVYLSLRRAESRLMSVDLQGSASPCVLAAVPHADDDTVQVMQSGRVMLTLHEPQGSRVVSAFLGGVATLGRGGASSAAPSPRRPRARDIGIPFRGTPGRWNAITDVSGVAVGFSTIISGSAEQLGSSVARTGVTAILPRGSNSLQQPVMAGACVLNGNGEVTGLHWLAESGFLEGPVMLTNTHSVGTVRDATIRWRLRAGPPDASDSSWSLPVVAETWDGTLNDINAFHVKEAHVFAALDAAQSGPLPEGNVGGGTGMHTHRWKGGTGTASRRVGEYAVGVLVQSNYGRPRQLTIAGVPVGAELVPPDTEEKEKENGSIIVVIATDAPLLPHQLQRLARRAPMGLGRMGSYAGNSSGDFMLAFSTANADTAFGNGPRSAVFLGNDGLDPLFLAVIEAVEEAICNAFIGAETMVGKDGATLHALPHEKLREILRRHGRLTH